MDIYEFSDCVEWFIGVCRKNEYYIGSIVVCCKKMVDENYDLCKCGCGEEFKSFRIYMVDVDVIPVNDLSIADDDDDDENNDDDDEKVNSYDDADPRNCYFGLCYPGRCLESELAGLKRASVAGFDNKIHHVMRELKNVEYNISVVDTFDNYVEANSILLYMLEDEDRPNWCDIYKCSKCGLFNSCEWCFICEHGEYTEMCIVCASGKWHPKCFHGKPRRRCVICRGLVVCAHGEYTRDCDMLSY